MGDGDAPKQEQQTPVPGQEARVEAGAEAGGAEPEESLLRLGETYGDAANRQPEAYRAEGTEFVATTVAGANARIDTIAQSPGLNLPQARLG